MKGLALWEVQQGWAFDPRLSDCPKLKDQNRGNKAGNKNGVGEARGKAYVLGGGDANPDSNVVKGTFLLNNNYASMIFDSGADRSFVSTTFSTLLDITPDTLDVSYAVELADGRIFETNTILRGCTLGLLGHPFNIDLMPIELGSFDVIFGMDCLANHHVVIVCNEKIVRIPYGDEVLIVQGDGDGKEDNSNLSNISCTKTQKYIKRGCPIFLAQVTKKEIENESKEKRLEDVPTVRDFPEVFLEDFPGLLPTRQVKFQIDLVPGAAPVACAPYRLTPTKLQEFSTQLQELSDKGFIRLTEQADCEELISTSENRRPWWFPAVVVAVVWQWHGEDGSGGSAAAVYPTALWFFENQARLLVRRTGRLVVVGDGTMVGCDDTHKENKGGGDEVAVGRRWVKVAAVGGGAWRRGG
ncbi:putative reverse transcriptase domain-containing protein [Tanacetum coccineum]